MLEKPIDIRRRHDAHVQARAEPRRLEQRRQSEQQPRPLPAFASRPRRERRGRSAAARACARSSPFPPSQRTPAQTQAVFSYWRTTVPEWKEANDADRGAVARASAKARRSWCCRRAKTAARHAPARRAATSCKPEQSRHAGRAGVPASAARRTRRRTGSTFARWLVDRQSPTTARSHRQPHLAGVFRHGPRGTARTSARRASRRRIPSCSTGWRSSSWITGWSLKHLHRLIVTSATYRQSSNVTPELLARDPDNRLLARGPRFRVEAEIVRDIALAASGLAESEGRRPERLSAGAGVPVPAAGQLRPEDLERRRRAPTAIAARCTRSASARCRIPMLQTFDAPNGDISCVRRVAVEHAAAGADDAERAAVPGVRASAGAADAATKAARPMRERLAYAFRRCLSRKPDRRKQDVTAGIARQADAALRRRLAERHGIWPATIRRRPPALPHGRHAGADLRPGPPLSRVLLNLDETITKE